MVIYRRWPHLVLPTVMLPDLRYIFSILDNSSHQGMSQLPVFSVCTILHFVVYYVEFQSVAVCMNKRISLAGAQT